MNKAASNHGSKSLSSYLTCKLVPSSSSSSSRHHAADADAGPREPQTATCCTALQRGFPSAGASHPRFAPLRTPSSALAPQDQEEHYNPIQEEEEQEEGQDQEKGQQHQQMRIKKMVTATAPATTKKMSTPREMVRKMVRKCKSSVADVDVSRITVGHDDGGTPRLRRSGAVQRDWSFEDLRTGAPHKAV